ncbi:MAG TPA: hemolysin III family protein [Acetobacteraceae bacterium]|nr:hemolysin III family protein [Acetobacteraceae bacterium]
MAPAASFPCYTPAEQALDRALHVFAVLLAAGGVAWLLFAVAPAGGVRQLIGLTVYGAGLIGMFVASAAYNSCRPCRAKELLRRVDHAMIFVMIAGTCTPFALLAFPESIGLLISAVIWISAAAGAVLKLAFPRRLERLLLALYLAMGWTMFAASQRYAGSLSHGVLLLLFGGGLAYSCGACVQARGRFRFHNVAWHGLVLLGAGLHWIAVADQVVIRRGL